MTATKLLTDNPELLHYIHGKLHITILGGIKLTGLDRLKVTLKVVCADRSRGDHPSIAIALPLLRDSIIKLFSAG